MLRSNEELAEKGNFGRSTVESFLSGEVNEIRIVVLLGNVRQDQVTRVPVKAIGIAKIFADRMIGKMAGAAQHALLDEPRVRSHFQHVQVMIGFKKQAISITKMHFNKLWQVAKIGDEGHFGAVATKRKADGIGRIVGNRESVNINIANGKALTYLDGFHTTNALAKSFRKTVPECVHSRLGDVEGSLPKCQHLRQTVAMVAVFVGNEDAVKAINGRFDGCEAGEGFALTEPGVNEEAGALGLE